MSPREPDPPDPMSGAAVVSDPVTADPVSGEPVAALGDDPTLRRAARELAESTDEGWTEATGRVLSALRASTRHSTPVNAVFAAGRDGDLLQVSDLVVISALRSALDSSADVAPRALRLSLGGPDGHDCLGVRIELVVTYGPDLTALARATRALVLDTLTSLLGPDRNMTPRTVDLVIADLTEGDPRA